MLAHLAEGIEYVVEVNQNLAFRDLGYIIHGLAGVIAHTGILISKAGEDWRDDDFEVAGKLLEAAGKTG